MSKRFVGVLTALTVFAPAVPVFAKTAVSIENVTQNQLQTVDKVLADVSDTISNAVNSIEVEEQKEEVSYVYYEQPEYTQVVYYETPVVEEVAPVMESVQVMNDSYQAALSNYEKALEAYYAASQLVETTKEEEVEVTEEVMDEEGNVSTITKTEIQTVTETAPAGDVDAAQAALDAASQALEQAQPAQTGNTVIDEDIISETVLTTAAANQCGDDATWSLSDMGVLRISGTGEMYNYTSTEHAPWYDQKLMINSLVVDTGITRIGNYAFDQCNNIASITLSDTVTSVGEYAFNNGGSSSSTSIIEIVIPDSVTMIESYAFNYCNSLKTVVMGTGLTTIGQYAFNFCSGLETVELGTGLTTIEKYAFNRCSKLTGITIPDSVTTIEDYAFNWCKDMTNVQFGTGLTSIGKQAFYQCQSIESVVLPDSLRTIGEGAFMLCASLNSITLNNGLQTIGNSVFRNCNSLTAIEIPSTVTSIGTNAFGSCASLLSINVDPSNTKYTSVDDILYDKEIKTLIQCPVGKTEVSIPDSVTKIGNSAFYQCSNLLSVAFTENITSLGSDAFYGCNGLSQVVLPDSVTTIGNSVFSMARNLTTVDLGASVISIPTFAFLSCDKMTSITLPSTLTSIASNAFTSCTALTDVYYGGTKKEWNDKHLFDFGENVTVHFAKEIPFTDVPADAWYYNVAKECYETGLISGTSSTTFSPLQEMTRAMVVTILWRLEGQPAVAFDDTFSDVSSRQWYATSISWAVQAGVVHGYGDGTFKPDAAVTREQVAVMLANYAQYKGVYVPGTKRLDSYPDGYQVSTWAQSGMKWALTEGIMTGNGAGYLNPKKSATRAEGAAMLLRMKNWL